MRQLPLEGSGEKPQGSEPWAAGCACSGHRACRPQIWASGHGLGILGTCWEAAGRWGPNCRTPEWAAFRHRRTEGKSPSPAVAPAPFPFPRSQAAAT